MTNGEAPKPAGPADPPGGRAAVDFEAIYKIIDHHFKVYEFDPDIKGLPPGEVAAYYVHTEPKTFPERFDRLRAELRASHPELVIVLQNRMGEDVLLVARKPQVPDKGITTHVVLFLLTLITTTISGAIFYLPIDGAKNELMAGGVDLTFLHPRLLLWGFLTFSLPLLLILGIHELGHFFVARRHHVKTTLPYFIPVPPPVPLGTFGAFISMREPIPDRKALFDIGASGPIVGFILAIPVVFLGMLLTSYQGAAVPPEPMLDAELDGPEGIPNNWESTAIPRNETRNEDEKWTVEEFRAVAANGSTLPGGNWTLSTQYLFLEGKESATANAEVRVMETSAPGTLREFNRSAFTFTADDPMENLTIPLAGNVTELRVRVEWKQPASGVVKLGDSILYIGLQYVVSWLAPTEDDLYSHPTAIAGWVGLLVTGFNLLPAGQLDGGHVARAVLGEKMRWASYASVLAMVALSFWFTGWLVMALLIVILGLNHPPPLNDKSPLDSRRKFVAFLILVLLLVTFVPFPFVPID